MDKKLAEYLKELEDNFDDILDQGNTGEDAVDMKEHAEYGMKILDRMEKDFKNKRIAQNIVSYMEWNDYRREHKNTKYKSEGDYLDTVEIQKKEVKKKEKKQEYEKIKKNKKKEIENSRKNVKNVTKQREKERVKM